MRRLIPVLVLLFASYGAAGQSYYSNAPSSRLGFGGAIAVDGDQVFVGSAPVGWPQGQDPAGEVYIFAMDSEGAGNLGDAEADWHEAGRLSAPDGMFGDQFGRSVVAADGKLLVSAPATSSLYVFERLDGEWQATRSLSPPDPLSEGFELGGAYARGGYRTQTLALAGDHVIATSYNGDTDEGSVHAVDADGNWATVADVPAWSVLGIGDVLFIGTAKSNEGQGGVLIFRLIEGTWKQTGELDTTGLDANANLGRSLAMNDGSMESERLFVGASAEGGLGAVLVYQRTNDAWTRTATLTQPDPDDGDYRGAPAFGQKLSISRNNLLVGANGAAFVYDLTDLTAEPARLDRPEGQKGQGFGVGIGMGHDFLAVGSPSADYGWGLAIIYERDESGGWREAWTGENDIPRFTSMTGGMVDCENGEAADLFPCENVNLVSFISAGDLVNDRGANLNDVWGWTDPVTGTEYVLAGRTDGISFVDISNPRQPLIVGQMMRTPGSPGAWWRDVKTYQNYAYVVADGSGDHGVQIFDLTRLRDVDPADMPVDFEPDALHTTLTSTHNIVINEETGYAYGVGSNACGGQLHMMDLNDDPLHPKDLGCYTNEETGGTHDAQCVVYHGSDQDYRGHEICMNSNGSAFVIADVTDKADPVTVALAEYPNTAYTHQGWLSEDHNYFYMNDELDEMNKIVDQTRTLVWDVRDLDEPTLIKEFYHGNEASDHNLYVRGNYLYESNYQSGLRILDITDPENPVEFGHFDTAPTAENVEGFGGSWSNYPYFESGIIVVSSQMEGLFMVRKKEVDL